MTGDVKMKALFALRNARGQLIPLHQGLAAVGPGSFAHKGTNCLKNWNECDCEIARTCREVYDAITDLESEFNSPK